MPNCSNCGIEVQGKNFKLRTCFDCKQKRKRKAARLALKPYVPHPKPKKIVSSAPIYSYKKNYGIIKPPKPIKESVETLWQRLLRSVKDGDY